MSKIGKRTFLRVEFIGKRTYYCCFRWEKCLQPVFIRLKKCDNIDLFGGKSVNNSCLFARKNVFLHSN